MERGEITRNPVAGIGAINRSPNVEATPWTATDLRAFKAVQPKGTTAHLWLTIQAFTACRIGDALWIGRQQEKTIDGTLWLKSSRAKKVQRLCPPRCYRHWWRPLEPRRSSVRATSSMTKVCRLRRSKHCAFGCSVGARQRG